MAVVMFASSLTVYDIFANREKYQIEIEGQDQGVQKGTCAFRL